MESAPQQTPDDSFGVHCPTHAMRQQQSKGLPGPQEKEKTHVGNVYLYDAAKEKDVVNVAFCDIYRATPITAETEETHTAGDEHNKPRTKFDTKNTSRWRKQGPEGGKTSLREQSRGTHVCMHTFTRRLDKNPVRQGRPFVRYTLVKGDTASPAQQHHTCKTDSLIWLGPHGQVAAQYPAESSVYEEGERSGQVQKEGEKKEAPALHKTATEQSGRER